MGLSSGKEGVFATEAKRGLARTFCQLFGLRLSSSYDIGRLTRRVASVLATEWARKMQHFMDIWLLDGGGDDDFVFSAADNDSFVPSPEFTTCIAAADLPAAALPKVDQIQNLHPR